MNQPLVSVIVPCYNEADVLPLFLKRIGNIAEALPECAFEFLFIDDGSRDATPALLANAALLDARVKCIRLSRNHGHQRAITAGTDFCQGDYIIIMDADLQDPPELIPQILEKLEAGYDVVHTVRADRSVDSWTKHTGSRLFYRLMRRFVLPELVEDAGDFKGFNRRALLALRTHRERVRFVRGAFATLGFEQTTLSFSRGERAAGSSKYPFKATLRLARNAVFSNSSLPLRLGLYAGALLLGSSLSASMAAMIYHLAVQPLAHPLLSALLLLVLSAAGLVLIMLGFVGEYLKILLLEVKQRPLYTISEATNVPIGAAPETLEFPSSH